MPASLEKPAKNKVVNVLRWVLGTQMIFGALIVYGVNQNQRLESDSAKQWALQRQIDRMYLDPQAPAISLEDRRRIIRLLFPKMKEAEIARYTGDK